MFSDPKKEHIQRVTDTRAGPGETRPLSGPAARARRERKSRWCWSGFSPNPRCCPGPTRGRVCNESLAFAQHSSRRQSAPAQGRSACPMSRSRPVWCFESNPEALLPDEVRWNRSRIRSSLSIHSHRASSRCCSARSGRRPRTSTLISSACLCPWPEEIRPGHNGLGQILRVRPGLQSVPPDRDSLTPDTDLPIPPVSTAAGTQDAASARPDRTR